MIGKNGNKAAPAGLLHDVLIDDNGTDIAPLAAGALSGPAPMTTGPLAATIGTNRNDTLYGDAAANLMQGYGGHDVLAGGLNNDTLLGGLGNDTLKGGYGNDMLNGGYSSDLLIGGPGRDTAVFDGGNVTVSLETARPQITGMGSDTLVEIENLTSGDGNDVLIGNGLNNVLIGGGAEDKLLGNSGNDDLIGGQGRDTLYGGAGNDTLRGGEGNDALIGGIGADVFSFDRLGTKDYVMDFEVGVDKLRIDVLDPANSGVSIGYGFNDAGVRVAWESGRSEVIIIGNFPYPEITADDLILF